MAGLFGDIEDRILSPLFLGGAALMSGEGMGGAFQGMRMGAGFEDQRRQRALEQQQKQQFEGLLGNVNVPPEIQAIARMQGPSAGSTTLANYVDPARKLNLDVKRAQLAKMDRENALATQEAARKKALQDAFLAPAAPAAGPQQEAIPASSTPVPGDVGRFAAPGIMPAAPARQPQTPREVFDALPPNKKAAAQLALMRGDMEGLQKIIAEGTPNLADNLSPGEKRVDQTFAKSYEDFILSGGAADFDKNLKQLRGVEGEISAGRTVGDKATPGTQKNLTGPLIGITPDWIGNMVNPDAVDARQKVEEIVQRNLRIILGAQFTQKEGENLIARAYNPSLSEEKNAIRLRALIGSMEKMKTAKMAAMDYFEKNGTMKGFKGTTQFSVDDILADVDAASATSGTGAKGRDVGGGFTVEMQ